MTSVLVVDYGGVLADHHLVHAESALALALGVDVERARTLLSERTEHGRAFRENRISEAEFWNRVTSLAQTRSRPDDGTLSRLWAETYRLNDDVARILSIVRSRAKVGVLTNIDRARSAYLLGVVGIMRMVDFYLPSYAYGATKPMRELWSAAALEIRRRYGVADVTYVDDRASHVDAAVAFGWHGFTFDTPPRLAVNLASRGLL